MKKETKRYFLVEYIGVRRIEFDTEEDIERNIENVRKYNNRKTPDFIVGNMTVKEENGKYVLYANIYKKLREKSTISDLDNYTSTFDEKGLIKNVYDKLITANEDKNVAKTSYYPDINIAYFEDKNMDERDETIRRIKYIPVLYEEDKKYLSESYIEKCISFHAEKKDYEFFRNMIETFKYNRSCNEELNKLDFAIVGVKYKGYNPSSLTYASMRLYRRLIIEKAKDGSNIRNYNGGYQISRRRQRDFGFFIKNYNSPIIKKATAYTYLDSTTKLKEMKALREEILKQRNEMGKQLTLKK